MPCWSKGDNGVWTDAGCELASVGHTIICKCTHLTNFAIMVVSAKVECYDAT